MGGCSTGKSYCQARDGPEPTLRWGRSSLKHSVRLATLIRPRGNLALHFPSWCKDHSPILDTWVSAPVHCAPSWRLCFLHTYLAAATALSGLTLWG